MFEGFGPAQPRLGARRASWSATSAARTTSRCWRRQERNIPLESFPSLFGKLFLDSSNARRSVVAGTHGKTTTSSLLAHVLHDAGRDPSFLIGGVPLNFRQSWRLGAGGDFVVEGDEYDTAFFDKGSKFLHYRPRIALLTSVEFDHADIFRDEEAVQRRVPQVRGADPRGRPAGRLRGVAGRDGGGARRPLPGGHLRPARLGRRLDVRGRRPRASAGAPTLALARRGERVGVVETNLPGIYNHENLIGVMAVASQPGHRAAGDRPRRAAVSRRAAAAGGARRRARRDRGRRLRPSPDGDPRDHPGAQGALRARQADRGVRAALGHQPPQRVPERLRRRAVGRRRGGAGAALRAGEGARRGSASTSRRLAADLRREDVPARVIATVEATVAHIAERASPGDTVAGDVARATTAACTTGCCWRWAIR